MTSNIAHNLEDCKAYWNEKAKDNPLYWIKSNKRKWDETEFFKTGEKDVSVIMERLPFKLEDMKDMTVIDYGCGVGRIAFAFAQYVDYIVGIDISEEYIRLAEDYSIQHKIYNTEFHATDGKEIINSSNCFDLFYSYLCFQHFPYTHMIVDVLKKSHRVLKQGGIIKFHHNHFSTKNKNSKHKKGHIDFGCNVSLRTIDKICKIGFKPVASYADAYYQHYGRGWWTILEKI